MLNGLFDEIGPRPLGLARVIVGGAALIRLIVAWQIMTGLTDPEVIRVPYADWLPDPSQTSTIVITAIWLVGAVLFTIGWRVPLSGTLLLTAIVSYLLLDQQTYSNHLYLMSWLVLLLTLAGAGSGLNIRRVDRAVVRWPVLLIMTQVSLVYGFSALTKLNASFLSGQVLAATLGTGLLPFPQAWRTPAVLSVMATVVVIVELFLAIFLWRRRFRPAAFVLGLGLHLAITLWMFGTLQLLVFSLEMLALYPLFLSRERLLLVWDDACGSCRDWVRRFQRLDVLRSLRPVGKTDPDNTIPPERVETSMHLIHGDEVVSGFRAVTLTLEHLVPTLWFAGLLRLPGIRGLGERWYRWQARRRSCLVGARAGSATER